MWFLIVAFLSTAMRAAVGRVCNYHVPAIRHIRYLLSTELAHTLACTLILSRLDYCNAVLHGAPAASRNCSAFRTQQHVSFSVCLNELLHSRS